MDADQKELKQDAAFKRAMEAAENRAQREKIHRENLDWKERAAEQKQQLQELLAEQKAADAKAAQAKKLAHDAEKAEAANQIRLHTTELNNEAKIQTAEVKAESDAQIAEIKAKHALDVMAFAHALKPDENEMAVAFHADIESINLESELVKKMADFTHKSRLLLLETELEIYKQEMLAAIPRHALDPEVIERAEKAAKQHAHDVAKKLPNNQSPFSDQK